MILRTLGENPFPSLFQLPHAAHIPWLVALSSTFKATNVSCSNFSLTLTLLPLPYKDPRDDTGPTQITQDNLPISKSLLSSHLQWRHLPCKVTTQRLGRFLREHHWEINILPTTSSTFSPRTHSRGTRTPPVSSSCHHVPSAPSSGQGSVLLGPDACTTFVS